MGQWPAVWNYENGVHMNRFAMWHKSYAQAEEGWELGDYVAYRCSGCNDRWDLIVNEEDAADQMPTAPTIADEARLILESRIEEMRKKDSE